MADSASLKKVACAAIDAAIKDLDIVSREIWEHPELNFEEKHAHDALSAFLEKHGFELQRNYILETGFRGMFGDKGKPIMLTPSPQKNILFLNL